MPPSPPPVGEKSADAPIGAVDIGGSHVAAAVIEFEPVQLVRERSSAAIDTHGEKDALLAAIGQTLRSVAAGARRWAIAMPGPFDYERGTGTFEGVAKFSTMAGLDLRAEFSAMLGVAPADLTFVNDAVAYGVGEWSVSDARPDRFACFTLGTGVGSAFLERGLAIESGPEVPPHGWAHLLKIDGVPLEDVVSTRAIQRRYARSRAGAVPTVREIAERARAGEDRARTILEAAMFELGNALGPWVARFGASEVVVGGSMARSWDLIGPAFEQGLAQHRRGDVTVVPSRLLDDAPLIGAATAARLAPTRP